MTLLTLEEAAAFLRLAKRTLRWRQDIPRVRYGHRVMFIQEDLEAWVLAHREMGDQRRQGGEGSPEQGNDHVDPPNRPVYHRNPVFVARASQNGQAR